MARSFNLPDLGEGIHEGEVVSVLVASGDEVKEGDPILEIETDKATVEIPSPYTGRVEEILVRPGDVVNVGDVLMTFGDGLAVKKEREGKPAQPAERPEMQVTPTKESRPVPASPATRRLARELRVDLQQVTPSGSRTGKLSHPTSDSYHPWSNQAPKPSWGESPREDHPTCAGSCAR